MKMNKINQFMFEFSVTQLCFVVLIQEVQIALDIFGKGHQHAT